MAPPCREQVVSELLVPTPLESDMMSLVSPALLSVGFSFAQRSVRFYIGNVLVSFDRAFKLYWVRDFLGRVLGIHRRRLLIFRVWDNKRVFFFTGDTMFVIR